MHDRAHIARLKTVLQQRACQYNRIMFFHSRRLARGYHTEMSDDDHTRLSQLLNKCKASVVVSGYDSPLYRKNYTGWRRVTKDIANHAAQGKSKVRETECFCMNF